MKENKKKKSKVILIVIGCLLFFVIGGLFTYRLIFSMGVTTAYQFGDPNAKDHFLIVTQKSNYKDAVLKEVEHKIKDTSYVDVVDVTELNTMKADKYKAVYILTTVQSSDIPEQVYEFWKQYPDVKSKLAFTAMSGRWDNSNKRKEDVDSIATASLKSNVKEIVDDILSYFEMIVK